MPCLTASARVQGRSPPLAGARRARARARACSGRAAAQLAGCAAQSGRTVQQPGPYSWLATAAVHSSKAARGGVAARPAVVARAAAVEEPVVAEALPAAEGIFIEDVTFDSEVRAVAYAGPPCCFYAGADTLGFRRFVWLRRRLKPEPQAAHFLRSCPMHSLHAAPAVPTLTWPHAPPVHVARCWPSPLILCRLAPLAAARDVHCARPAGEHGASRPGVCRPH